MPKAAGTHVSVATATSRVKGAARDLHARTAGNVSNARTHSRPGRNAAIVTSADLRTRRGSRIVTNVDLRISHGSRIVTNAELRTRRGNRIVTIVDLLTRHDSRTVTNAGLRIRRGNRVLPAVSLRPNRGTGTTNTGGGDAAGAIAAAAEARNRRLAKISIAQHRPSRLRWPRLLPPNSHPLRRHRKRPSRSTNRP
jgi:hypothetical protein